MTTPNTPLRINPVADGERELAMRLVFGRLAEQQQQPLQTILAEVSGSEATLLGAYHGEQLVGAVFMQVQPGKTANFWPPQLAAGEPPDSAQRLLEAGMRLLRSRGVRVVQALLPTNGGQEGVLLREGRFEHLADLYYLVAVDSLFPTSQPQGPLKFDAYSAESLPRLVRIVDATYRQTQDCPQLNGLRDTEDVLAGYRATGVFDPSRWLLVRHGDRDVGCLLVADHPQQEVCELVYMGVVPEARGQGWGMEIAKHAQWLAHRAGRQRLVLAVDAANEPALRMYEAVGFRAWDRRAAYLRILPAT